MKKLALIIGYGSSGKAAARLARSRDFQVLIADKNYREIGKKALCVSDEALLDPKEFDAVIVSPGVHPENRLYKRMQNHPNFMGEVEFALKYGHLKAIAITGSNGKTTLTSFIAFALNQAKIPAIAAGNIGLTLSEVALDYTGQWVICELSSFQLETMKGKYFELGAIINITPDHLDRYKDFESYFFSKLKLIESIKKNKKVLLPPDVFNRLKTLRNDIKYSIVETGSCSNLKKLQETLKLSGKVYDLLTLKWMEEVLKAFHVSDEIFVKSLLEFCKPKHRLEFVKTIQGIDFYNDSKSTNLDSLSFALKSFSRPVHLILGGKDKGLEFSLLKKELFRHVKIIYALGETKEKIAASLNKHVNVVKVESLDQAVKEAYLGARENDVVLLSPGCSSLDQFDHFQQRGDVFVKHVLALK